MRPVTDDKLSDDENFVLQNYICDSPKFVEFQEEGYNGDEDRPLLLDDSDSDDKDNFGPPLLDNSDTNDEYNSNPDAVKKCNKISLQVCLPKSPTLV